MANLYQEKVTRRVIFGCAYVSGNGQLVIDQHASDAEHLTAPQTRSEQPLYDCRVYFSDLLPKEWLGKRGEFTIHQVYDAGGEVAAFQVVFTPAAAGTAPG